jgi:YD repeat-containing protein
MLSGRAKLVDLLGLLISLFLCAGLSPSANLGVQGQSSNTTTTRTNNADGSTTVTTTTTYNDGSTTTTTTYDNQGHDTGTTRTDVQTKDGETTTTVTKYDGNGHETGKTITRVKKNGSTTVTTYDGNGHETGTTKTDVETSTGTTTTTTTTYDGSGHMTGKTVTVDNPDGTTTVTTYDANGNPITVTLPPIQYKLDLKLDLKYKFNDDFKYDFKYDDKKPYKLSTSQLFGMVYDKDSRPGDNVVVSFVTNPEDYANIPGLGVLRLQIPTIEGSPLQGLTVDAGDGLNQPAIQPVKVQISRTDPDKPLRVFQGLLQVARITFVPAPSNEPVTPVQNTGKASDFRTPPVCQGTSLISGPLGRDPQTTRLFIDHQPARILTETPRSAYFNVPPGAHNVVLQKGQRRAGFQVVSMQFGMNADQLQLQKGQITNYSATVRAEIPDDVWRRGGVVQELTDLSHLDHVAPGFHVPREGEPGVVLFHVQNASLGTITIKPSRNEMVTHLLHKQDFQNGQFTERGIIQSKRSGGFTLNGLVQAFFAPVAGSEISPGSLLGTQ